MAASRLSLHPERGRLKSVCCLAAALLCLWVPVHSQDKAPAQRPSLDLLVERAEAFWAALAQADKLRALEYVEAASRDIFIQLQPPPFAAPRVARLEPAREAGEVLVTVEVERMLPPLASPVTWPVTNKWVFREGNWSVVIDRILPPFLTAPSQYVPKPALSPQEVESRVKRIRRLLSFETTDLDFGTVRQGKLAKLSIGYRLAGDMPMDLVFRDPPEDLVVHGLDGRKFQPGEGRRIEFEFPTELMSGKVERSFAIVVKHDEVEVPFEFKLRVDVYAPVAALPPLVRIRSGEREKEILITNNSKSAVRIKEPAEASNEFSVQPLPLELPPGASAKVTLKVLLPIERKNYRADLSLDFAEPVEGMESLNLPIVVNPVQEKPLDFKNLTPQQIEELIRKAKKPEFR